MNKNLKSAGGERKRKRGFFFTGKSPIVFYSICTRIRNRWGENATGGEFRYVGRIFGANNDIFGRINKFICIQSSDETRDMKNVLPWRPRVKLGQVENK